MYQMIAMYQDQHWGRGDLYTTTGEYRFGPLATCAQISLGSHEEFEDKSFAFAYFLECTFIDQNGVPRTDPFPTTNEADVRVFARNNLVSAKWRLGAFDCWASFIFNLFHFDEVYPTPW